MGEDNPKPGRAMRLIVSEGWADEDPDVVAQLLEQARAMATLTLADNKASAELRAMAADFLDRLRSDTAG